MVLSLGIREGKREGDLHTTLTSALSSSRLFLPYGALAREGPRTAVLDSQESERPLDGGRNQGLMGDRRGDQDRERWAIGLQRPRRNRQTGSAEVERCSSGCSSNSSSKPARAKATSSHQLNTCVFSSAGFF